MLVNFLALSSETLSPDSHLEFGCPPFNIKLSKRYTWPWLELLQCHFYEMLSALLSLNHFLEVLFWPLASAPVISHVFQLKWTQNLCCEKSVGSPATTQRLKWSFQYKSLKALQQVKRVTRNMTSTGLCTMLFVTQGQTVYYNLLRYPS